MQPVSRRSFIATGSAGALGVAGAAVLGNPLAAGASVDSAELTSRDYHQVSGPILLAVRDPRGSKVELLVGTKTIEFSDRGLVRKLIRAAG
ncbi:MAG TPA: hypothetical protein VFI47_05780 [Acidimicrobiales bacterium]|nr:hypothetical protein [Acidimicrobiales bacterium]